jgi:phosphoenolpyruvate carboxykinase (ATP)
MMYSEAKSRSPVGLDAHSIKNVNNVYWNLSTSLLYEEAIRRREGRLAHLGPLVVRTGQHTGRAPNDKFIVREPSSENHIWWGKVNQIMESDRFEALYRRLLAYLQGKDLFVQDCFVGADHDYKMPIRVITETAWHNLFARNLFIQAKLSELANHVPEFTVLNAPNFHAEPEIDGTKTEVFVVVHFGKKIVLIGGTQYAGEIKKSVFTIMNYILPQKGVLSMHCSANQGPDGKVAIFFGLSGTGKTTLSADSTRTLIGDDEHGWSESGIFNFEGGCYAKVIRLSQTAEPEIYNTTRRFGTILENVGFDSGTGRLNLDDDSLTENTRAAYPISHIPNATRDGLGGHPNHIIMLTADAFGVLPPLARLTPHQAMYYFLSGYTARVAGTEKGVHEPSATFSTCFGAPFLPLRPISYARLLGEKLSRHDSKVWLVNTGWTGGPYGLGHRVPISYTRGMVHAILNNAMDKVPTRDDPFFGIQVPEYCPDVPAEVLNPRSTWEDPDAYDDQARKLVQMFVDNFEQFEDDASDAVKNAGPTIE